MKKFWLLWKAARGILQVVNNLDKFVAHRFSDQWWLELRKGVEVKLIAAYESRDRGWQKIIEGDNAILLGLLLFLKSDAVYAYWMAVEKYDDVARKAARKNAKNKDATRTNEKLRAASR